MKWKRPHFPKNRFKANKFSQKLPARFRDPKRNRQTINSMLPNIATLMALCTGLTAVRFAIDGRFEMAVMAILIAGVLDGMDGKIARFLGSTSRFGAELDSLSDFISFGISPALVIYLNTLNTLGGLGWIFALLFSVCMGLRLARFNTFSIEGSPEDWPEEYFMGVPAPAGALMALTPLIMSFVFKEMGWGNSMTNPYLNGIFLCVASSLMVSRIPTFSIKKLHIPHKYIVPFFLALAILAGALYVEPWGVLSFICIGYILLIPFSIHAFRNRKK